MKSVKTTKFDKAFENLPSEIQQKAKKAYQFWKLSPNHSSLQFKQVSKTKPVYSIRITLSYRALGLKEGDTMIWFWIGSHADYDNLIKQLS